MRVFISNLPRETRGIDLKNAFSEHGRVLKAWLVEDPETGFHKGIGFVEMPFGDAMKAIKAMNRSWFKNKRINVQKSRFMPRPPRERRREYAH